MNRFASHLAAVFAGLLLVAPGGVHARSTGTAIGRGAPKQRVAKQRGAKLRRGARARASARRPARSGRAFVQLRAGQGYQLMRPHQAWGTRYAVTHLGNVLAAHHAAYPDGPALTIGDLSRRRGGRIRVHRSHRNGRDVDIWLPKQAESRQRVDLPRIWALISAFHKSAAVEMIFLDYRLQRVLYRYAERELGLPRDELGEIFEYPSRRRPKGAIESLIIHSDGHRDHIHVRFHGRKLEQPPTT